jgi:hypothetical protein
MSGYGPQLRVRGGGRSKQLSVPGGCGRPLELGSGERARRMSVNVFFPRGGREGETVNPSTLPVAPGKGAETIARGVQQNGTATTLQGAADIDQAKVVDISSGCRRRRNNQEESASSRRDGSTHTWTAWPEFLVVRVRGTAELCRENTAGVALFL